VHATPGRGTNVPLYILGSSLFGAQLAAVLGLPYAFASHFAPAALHEAVALYRQRFEPSAQLERPYVIAGVNVIAADTEAAAHEQLQLTRRARVRHLFGRDGRPISDDDADLILQSPRAAAVDQMMTYTAAGVPAAVQEFMEDFADHSGADELIVVPQGAAAAERLRSLELLADVARLVPA
jgi:luciferase family oxidoreductase group 1